MSGARRSHRGAGIPVSADGAATAPASEPGPAKRVRGKVNYAAVTPLVKDADDSAAEAIVEKSFWMQFDTELLLAWLLDYPKGQAMNITAEQRVNREFILAALVHSKWVQRPRLGDEIAQLRAVWARTAGKDAIHLPGMYKQPSSVDNQSPSTSSPVVRELFKASGQKAPARAKVAEREDLSDLADYDEEGDMEDETPTPFPIRVGKRKQLDSAASSSSSAAAGTWGASNATPPAVFMKCPHCMAKAMGETDLCFNCANCGMIANQPESSPMNQKLTAFRLGTRAPTAAASSSSSAASGQSTTDTLFEASSLDRVREKEYKDIMKVVPAQPLFAPLPEGTLFTHAQALSVSAGALGASAFAIPSESLVQIIRDGKLIHVGYAKPQRLDEMYGAKVAGQLSLSDGGISVTSKGGPPRVNSIEEFFNALVGTILPALIDRPRAAAEWISLARTALEVHAMSGRNWATVQAFIDQQLHERVFAKQAISDPSTRVLTATVFMQQRPAQHVAASGAQAPIPQQQRGPASNDDFCQNHNWRGGCSAPNCTRKHECQFGSKGCRTTTEHASKDCPAKPQRDDRSRTPAKSRAPGSVHTAPPSGGGSAPSKKD